MDGWIDWSAAWMSEWVLSGPPFRTKPLAWAGLDGLTDWLADDDRVIVWMDWLTGWWWLSDGLTDWMDWLTDDWVMDWLTGRWWWLSDGLTDCPIWMDILVCFRRKTKGVWLDGLTDWLVDDWFDPCVFQDKQKISKDKPLIWPLCISGWREDQSEPATDLTHVCFRTKRRPVKTSHWFDPCAFQDKEKISKDKPLFWPLCLSGQREDQ